jgi:hypothetical protein
LNEWLGVRARAAGLDLSGQLLNGRFSKESLPLCRVVATACSELTEETNGIDDTEFSDERISGSLRYLRDGVKVCTH